MCGSVCIPECMCAHPTVVKIKGRSKGEARLLALEGRNVQSKADPTCPLPAVSGRVLLFTQWARFLEQTLWQGCGLSGNTYYVVWRVLSSEYFASVTSFNPHTGL